MSLRQYQILSEDQKCWATCLDLDKAKKIESIANAGGFQKRGWVGETYSIYYIDVPLKDVVEGYW